MDSPSGGGDAPAVAKHEVRRNRRVTVLSAFHRRPPGSSEGDDQAGGGDEAGQNGGSPGLVGGGTGGIDGLIDALLGLLLRDAGALRDELGQIGAIFGADRTARDRSCQDAGDLCADVVGGGRVAVRARGAAAGAPAAGGAAAALVGRSMVSRTRSIGSPVEATDAAALPATSAPVLATSPAVANTRNAPDQDGRPPRRGRHAGRRGIRLHGQALASASACGRPRSRRP